MRQHEVFERLKHRAARSNNLSDEKLLDIIDSYETQLHQYRTELDLYRGDEGRGQSRGEGRGPSRGEEGQTGRGLSPEHNVRDASANYKGLIKVNNTTEYLFNFIIYE